jgi:hypothetical protein
MEECFQMQRSANDYTPGQMWTNCGHAAAQAVTGNAPASAVTPADSSKVWSAAYHELINLEECPRNLLPVYRSSPQLQVLSLDPSRMVVTCPEEFYRVLDENSDKLCSLIFGRYFKEIGLK